MRTPTFAALVALTLIAPAAPSLAQDTANGEAFFSSGVMHLREGRSGMALDQFKRAVKAEPENPYFRKGLGQAYASARQWKEAIKQFRKALQINPYYVDIRNDLGSALVLAGKRDEGRDEFLTAYSDPTNPTPEVSARNLGQAYLDEKNYTEAISWFRTALGRTDTYADSYLGLAEAFVATERIEEAVVLLESGVEKVPQDPVLHLALGQVYHRAGRFTEARSQLEEAMRKDPSGLVGQAAADELARLPD